MSDSTTVIEQQGDPQQLGDAGKKALQAERDAREQAEKRVKDLEQQLTTARASFETEKQTLQASIDDLTGQLTNESDRAATAERAALKVRIAARKGLPEHLADRLQGDDEAALEADADQFAQLAVGQGKTMPKPDPSQGAKGGGGDTSVAQQFADAVKNQL